MLRKRAENPVRDLDRTAADWVSTLILTGWRATECAALEWSWINFDAKTITIPGDVDTEDERLFAGVKTHEEMTWPMSDVLHDILKARSNSTARTSATSSPAARTMTCRTSRTRAATMKARLQLAAGEPVLSPHDLRRGAVHIARACRVDYNLRMRLLNHKPQAVHDDYENDRNPETLRPAVNAIAKYIADAAAVAEAQATGANVINLADRKRAN